MTRWFIGFAGLAIIGCVTPAAAQDKAASQQSAASPEPEGGDPFARLRVRIPRDQLGPVASVRIRDRREHPGGKISVTIKTTPAGAKVTYGSKNLGLTPITLTAEHDSTPLDIVIRKPGFMLLRTRVERRVTRTYAFRLTPAKLQ